MTRIPSRRRNLGIIAHVDAGKTTLTERILFHGGRIHRIGDVDAGNTRTDSRQDERDRGITIGAAAVSCEWREHALTLIDTPGHADFTLEVERSLRVLDGAVVLLDAVAGVEPQTEKVWRQAERHGVARIAFINKLDRAGADLDRGVRSLRERLGAEPVLLTVPIGAEGELRGVVDVVRQRAFTFDAEGRATPLDEVPAEARPAAERAREALLEACATVDDALLSAALDGSATETDLLAALRRGTAAGLFLPTLCGSAAKNLAVPTLLDAVVDLLPAPEQAPDLVEVDGGRTRPRSASAPLAALCFKVVVDTYGTRTFVRVFSGTLRRGDSVAVGAGRKKLRVGRLVHLFADEVEEVDEVAAGGIAAVIGAPLTTGDTLSAPDDRFLLEPVEAPESVIRVAIEAKSREDRDKLPGALEKLRLEDPSLRVEADPETGQTTLAGMGQLHLEVAVGRLAEQHGVTVEVGAPGVAYRETLRGAAEVDHLHKQQSGGPGQYARVVLTVEPADPGTGLVFEDRIRGGVIPRAYIPGVRKGVEAAATSGVLAGYPVVDVRVALVDGATHPNDSSELAFEIAGRTAFREACRQAGPTLLEPVMRLEVQVPEAHLGDVIGDLAARRGEVLDMLPERAQFTVVAEVPLANLFGYAGALASLARGRGTHHLQLARYAPVPEPLVPGALRRT